MGALIGLTIQLAVLAIRQAVMLVVWTVRLAIMAVAMIAAAVSSRSR